MLLKLLMLRVAFFVTRGMSSFSRRSLAILALCLLLRLLRISSFYCLTVHRSLLIWASMTRQTPSVTIARMDNNTMHLLQRNPNYLRIYEEIQQNSEWQVDKNFVPRLFTGISFCKLPGTRFLSTRNWDCSISIGFHLKEIYLSWNNELICLSCFHGSVLCSVLMYDLKLRNGTPTLSPNRKQFVSKVLPQLAGLQELAREKEMGGSDVSVENAGDIEKDVVKDESRDSDDRKEAIKRLKTSECF